MLCTGFLCNLILFSLLLDVELDQFSCDISSICFASEMFDSDFCIQFLMCGVGRVQHSVCLCGATEMFCGILFVRPLVRAYIVWASCEGNKAWAAHVFLDKSLRIKPVIQRRLNFLKAVRIGRYVLNGLVRWASCQGTLSSGRSFSFR